ncbi:MAG: hypothetical protein WCQ26_02000 [Pseudanabaena sp. ELA748]
MNTKLVESLAQVIESLAADEYALIMPISYAISGAIALSAIAAFLRQLFNLGKE